ncbi:hypothetical protein APHAL10511_006049 [Amanita phalloides]|nr:hypothetical protein APHAL10511_006049 [Amanita phalloides]
MSFQHFRLALSQSQPASVALYQPHIQEDPSKSLPSPTSHPKQPYGSGDSDDGYTLAFANLAAFQEWRAAEEERQMVEFVKGDTHGSKAVPPRFKDHTKLVCARHSRSGRKKYIKKHPERVRKVPSRKLEGIGCPASISYKTYFDTEEVRACYASQHSHPVGLANLPFTRKGRKAAALQEKERRSRSTNVPDDHMHTPIPEPPSADPETNTTNQSIVPQAPIQSQPHATPTTAATMVSPTATQNSYQQAPSTAYVYSNPMAAHSYVQTHNLPHDRWENMTTLFHSVRENARTFEYPSVSVAALESILIRMYLESPMSYTPQSMGATRVQGGESGGVIVINNASACSQAMSALSFARQALGFEKPHSSVTDWIDILTSNKITEEAYDGIPELVDAITLQASGPAEAARALRKKLKHGQSHQQYRALVILKALVENAGSKFHTALLDDQIVDTFRQLNYDPRTDKRVKKKLLLVLASWKNQYQADPAMSVFAGLYAQSKGDSRAHAELAYFIAPGTVKDEKKKTKGDAKRKEKLEQEERRKKEKEGRRKRVPFNLERERPDVLSAIAGASQASSNLANAITLVNTQTESVRDNERVKECLAKAAQSRKPLVRYIQLVEDEDLIGALIETNDRIVSALQMYNLIKGTEDVPDDTKEIARDLEATRINSPIDNDRESQHKSVDSQETKVHPDLQDLSFGPLGASSSRLPAPIKPSNLSDSYYDHRRGDLSDFSDYNSSSDGEYVDVSNDDIYTNKITRASVASHEDDPFADPFADERAVPLHK